MLDTSHNCHQFKLVSQGLDRPPHCAAGLDHLSVLVRVRLLSVTIVNNPEFCHYCHQFRLLSLLSDYKGFTDRHTVPPALTICPCSSEDEQSWRLPLASTLNIKLQKTSMSGFFLQKLRKVSSRHEWPIEDVWGRGFALTCENNDGERFCYSSIVTGEYDEYSCTLYNGQSLAP